MKRLRHTASHVMAQAVKRLWPDTKLAIGPAIENGFYYDFDSNHHFSDEDLLIIENEMSKIIKEDLKLVPEIIDRKKALELFKDEPYKLELIEGIPEEKEISIYRQGDFFDLCAGPHVGSTGEIKAFKLLNIAGAYWRGDEHNKMLQRIYGTAFTSKDDLASYLYFLKEAAESDHRKLGSEHGIFALSEEAPGMPFFLPNGMTIICELLAYWREIHKRYGYREIRTPLILKRRLWEISGHWNHYSQGMYTLSIDNEDYAVKPMNCPGAIRCFAELCRQKSTKLREFGEVRGNLGESVKLAEVGLVHRAERSGQLHGLMRVREFTQDDAHIFCEIGEVRGEILQILSMVREMYGVLGLEYRLELSTRPEDRIGSDEVWDAAEGALKTALESANYEYEINEGEGAFYGPKIDIHIRDRLGRSWQCGTVQVDFNLPERFELEGQVKRKVIMIHRVVYGSIERFVGILVEHFKGRMPLWLAPTQVRVVPLRAEYEAAAEALGERLAAAGLRVDGDFRDETVRKRVKVATLDLVPYVVVIGEREAAGGELHVKRLGGEDFDLPAEYFIRYLQKKVARKALRY